MRRILEFTWLISVRAASEDAAQFVLLVSPPWRLQTTATLCFGELLPCAGAEWQASLSSAVVFAMCARRHKSRPSLRLQFYTGKVCLSFKHPPLAMKIYLMRLRQKCWRVKLCIQICFMLRSVVFFFLMFLRKLKWQSTKWNVRSSDNADTFNYVEQRGL